MQNQAARLVYGQPKFHYVKPLLKSLHWLPVTQRSLFKLGCMIFKALSDHGPGFIATKIQRYVPTLELRSSNMNLLFPCPFKRKKHGGLRFSTLAPQFWNSLPPKLRLATSYSKFRTSLKTWFFAQAYN